MSYRLSVAVLAVATALSATPAAAQTFEFEGMRENVTPVNPPGGRCVPPYANTVSIAPGNLSSTGTSNLGSFTATQSFCVASLPPTPVIDGEFTYTFRAGDTIFGTYDGNAGATGVPGVFDAVENYIITGGTGRFAGASGTLTTTGVLSLGMGPTGPVTIYEGDIVGSIVATTATASGEFATALGGPSAATGDYSTSVGAFSTATAERATALGSFAEATGAGAVAVGDTTVASGPAAVALGQGAEATGPAASALGHNTTASGVGSTAAGVRAEATALNATAIGSNASATFAGSTAVGQRATTTADNQVALGAAGSSVRIGDIAASTAAQSGPVGVATVDASGTLGVNNTIIPSIAALQTMGSAMQGQIDALFDLADVNRRDVRRAYEGVAMALAMDSPNLSASGQFALSGGIGFYGDRVAGTAAFTARVGPSSAISGGIGVGFNSGRVGGRAGFQHEW